MSSDVIFRTATEDDLPAIVALPADDVIGAGPATTAGTDTYRAAFAAIAADPRNHLVVADVGGTVAGTLQLTFIPRLSRAGAERAQIEAVRVAAAHRGERLGRRMIGWAVDQAAGRGCRLVQLTSDKHRTDALRFYESLGFEATHERLKLPL